VWLENKLGRTQGRIAQLKGKTTPVLFQILNRIAQLECQVLELTSQADEAKRLAVVANKALEKLLIANEQSAKYGAEATEKASLQAGTVKNAV
jgi:DNA-binding Xre family transcriptional regulator